MAAGCGEPSSWLPLFRLICVNAGLFEQVHRGEAQGRASGLDRTEWLLGTYTAAVLAASGRTGSLVSGGPNGLVWRCSTDNPYAAGLL